MSKEKKRNFSKKSRWLRIGLMLFRLPGIILQVLAEMVKAIYEIKSKPSLQPPFSSESQLKGTVYPQAITLRWSCKISKANCIGFGDWEGDGNLKILIADSEKQLHLVDIEGNITSSFTLPANFSYMECSWHQDSGIRLLGVSPTHKKLYVIDRHGKTLWHYSRWMGIANVHWGDLNGDKHDEIVLITSWPGRLVALTDEGQSFWKASTIGIWNQTIIPHHFDRRPLVLATEARGTINVYEHTGKLLRTLRPKGLYFGTISASIIDDSDTIQIVAIGRKEDTFEVLAFDLSGNVAWNTPTYEDLWMKGDFTSEDMNGDGIREWAFIETPGELVFVSPHGEKLAALSVSKDLEQFLIVPQPDGYGMLVTLQAGIVTAYQFEREED